MSAAEILLQLAGAVALLIWSTRMVRTGFQRAYGKQIKRILAGTLVNRFTAAGGGLLIAMLMQSSTAVVLIVSGFVAAGQLSTVAAIGAVVGADLGSALVVKILRLDLTLVVPVFLLAGTLAFRMSSERQPRQIGRILLGLGLLLLSLQLIASASLPLRESPGVPVLMSYLSSDWITLALLIALLTWLLHSSIAAILLFAVLADRTVVAADLVVPVVLGINLGAGVIAFTLTRDVHGLGRIAPVVNLMLRGGLAVVTLAVVLGAGIEVPVFLARPGDQLVLLHIAFNLLVCVTGLMFASPLASLGALLLADRERTGAEPIARRSALIESDLGRPSIAAQNVARELVAMGERVESMIVRVPALLNEPDEHGFQAITRLDDEVDSIHTAIKLYIARVDEVPGEPEAHHRLANLLAAAIRLEQIGDIIVHKLVARARKKQRSGAHFSDDGWRELSELHEEVMHSVRLSLNILVSGDLAMARELTGQKEVLRELETRSSRHHIDRIRTGLSASLETSDVHIDAIYDLKEINSLLVTIAYPILDDAGELRPNRLRKPQAREV